MKLTDGLYLRGKTYWLNFTQDGKRFRISLETEDEMDAIRRAKEVRQAPQLAPGGDFKAIIERYLTEKRRLNIHSPATERVTRAALMEFAERVGTVAITSIAPAKAREHYDALQTRVKETTAQIHIRALRAFFNWSVKEKLIRTSPFAELALRQVVVYSRLRWCTKEQRNELINNAPTDDLKFILFCGFHCGMRKNEIIEARANWFDLSGSGSVYIQNTDTFTIKDKDAKHIPLTQQFRTFLETYLKDLKGDQFPLCPKVKQGKGTYRYDFHRPYNDYMTERKVRWCTTHVMRHTFASLLVQSGVSIYKVARWMGDGVEVVQKHYAHLAPQDSDIEKMQ